MTRTFLLLSACTIFVGCAAQTASLRQLEPNQIDSLPRRLAVLDVDGHEERAPLAQSTLMKRLDELGFYSVIEESELQRASREPLRNANRELNMPSTLAAARQLGIDALLLTKLELTETDSTLYGSISLPIGDPQITATLEYELINARTGATLDQNAVASDMYQGKLKAHGTGNSSQTMILAGLTRQATNRLAQRLAPHTSEVEVRLAEMILGPGSEALRRGNKAAQVGNWDRAADQWTTALERDPRNDAAWYNLALAFDAMQQYARAKQAYERALTIQDRTLYREGLERSEQAAGQYHLAMAQRINGRGVSAESEPRLAWQPAFAPPTAAVPDGSSQNAAVSSQPRWSATVQPATEPGRMTVPTEPPPSLTRGWPSDLPATPATVSNPEPPIDRGALPIDARHDSAPEMPPMSATTPARAARNSAFIPAAL